MDASKSVIRSRRSRCLRFQSVLDVKPRLVKIRMDFRPKERGFDGSKSSKSIWNHFVDLLAAPTKVNRKISILSTARSSRPSAFIADSGCHSINIENSIERQGRNVHGTNWNIWNICLLLEFAGRSTTEHVARDYWKRGQGNFARYLYVRLIDDRWLTMSGLDITWACSSVRVYKVSLFLVCSFLLWVFLLFLLRVYRELTGRRVSASVSLGTRFLSIFFLPRSYPYETLCGNLSNRILTTS